MHRWTKPTKVWRPACRDAKPGDFGVLAEVRREQEAWARIWRVDEAGRAHTLRPWEEAPAMRWQPITGEDVDRASRSFKARTGLGADDLHPRVFSLLSDQGKEAVGQYLTRCERSRFWPRQASPLIVWLAPKEDGGRRPINLLATLIRLWEEIRAPAHRQWQLNHQRPWGALEISCFQRSPIG